VAAGLGDIDNMSWVVTANLLCATAATPLYGKLSDIHGRRTMMLIAITIYAGGSLACALAPSMLTLILARGLQGLGSGGLMPLVQTNHRRRRLAARSAALSGLYVVDLHHLDGGRPDPRRLHSRASALVLDLLVQLAALRACLSAHPQRAAAAAAPRSPAQTRSAGRVADGRRGDRADACAELGRAAIWLGLAPILTVLSASLALWALFAWRVMAAEEPFVPLSVLRDGAVRVGTAAGFFVVGLVIALTIVLPLYAQLALGLTVSESAWTIIALQGAATVTSIFCGRLRVSFSHF